MDNEYYWIPLHYPDSSFDCSEDTCYYTANRQNVVDRHITTCDPEMKVVSKQDCYGGKSNDFDELVEAGYLSDEYRSFNHNYLAVYDIETIENIQSSSTVEAKLELLSIAVSTNLPNQQDKFFCRKTNDSEDAHSIVVEFLDYLEELQAVLEETIPEEISDAILILEEEIEAEKFSKRKMLKKKYLRTLKSLSLLNCYGFNSGKVNFSKQNN